MLSEEDKKQILDSIEKFGKAEEPEILINRNIRDILNFSSGSPRIQPTAAKRATLIMSQPSELALLHNLQIRCVLCHQVISYPAWYYVIRYVVNQFYYFICFDSLSPDKPTTKCYRRV